jgi:uncharacterized protein YbaR (Trm112 family)
VKTPEERAAANRANAKAYRAAHLEECKAKSRAYHAAHREEIAANKRVYHQSHKEEILAKQKKRRDETGNAYQKEYRNRPGVQEHIREIAKIRHRKPAYRAQSLTYHKAYYAAHRDEALAYAKLYRQRPETQSRLRTPEHKVKARESHKKYWAVKGRARYQERWLGQYGLTREGRAELLESQNNRCPICRTAETKEHPLHVDHDHVTGQVRGLLCGNCNRAYGLLKESPLIIKAMLAYDRKCNTWIEKEG